MTYLQPNLPAYNQYKRKPAAFGQVAASIGTSLAGGITAAANKKEKAAKERKKLEADADAMEMNFLNLYKDQEKSSIVQMDEANRALVESTASNLNNLYIKAYGSEGTKEARAEYKTEHAQAMEMLKEIGEYSNIQSINQKALEKNTQSSKLNFTQGLLTDATMYGGLADQYRSASQLRSGEAADYQVVRENGHTIFKYKLLNPNYDPQETDVNKPGYGKYVREDVNGVMQDKVISNDMTTQVASFKKNGETLETYSVGKDDLLSTQYQSFKDNYISKGLISKGITKITQTYDPVNKKHIKTKIIDREAFDEVLNGPNGDKINFALDQDMKVSNFNKKYFQMSKDKAINNDGLNGELPLSDLPWGFSSKMSDQEFKDFNKNITSIIKGGANTTSQSPPTHFKGGPLGDEEIADPTPGDGKLTREDLFTIQQMSGKQMLINYYSQQNPEGEETQSSTDKFDYERDAAGNYSSKTKKSFDRKKPAYNNVKGAFDVDFWNDKDDHSKGVKVNDLKGYSNLLNQVATRQAGGGSAPKITYMTGADVNTQINPATPFDDTKIYKITMGGQGQINKVDDSQFSENDLSGDPEDLYQMVMSSYGIDDEMQGYYEGKIK